MTPYETIVTFFKKALYHLRDNDESNKPLLENLEVWILQTLQNFVQHKADLSQEVYCLFCQGAFCDSSLTALETISKDLRFKIKDRENVILLRIPVSELLRRSGQNSQGTRFGDQLAQIMSEYSPQTPEILAVGYENIKTWSKSARRVDGILAQRLLEVIMRKKPLQSTSEAIELQIQREIDEIIEVHDFDGVEPEDLTDYLLFDEGLLRNNPITLWHWFMENADWATWDETDRARKTPPTKFVRDVVSDDYTEVFTLLWGLD